MNERGYATVIFSLIIVIIILLSLLSYLFIVSKKSLTGPHDLETLCLTPACVKASSAILSRLDTTIDPCQDFYSFVCGSFVQTKTVPDHLTTYDMLQSIEEYSSNEMRKFLESNVTESDGLAISKAKMFYNSCLEDRSVNNETETVSALIESMIESAGPWPLLSRLLDKSSVQQSSIMENRIFDTFLYQVQSIFRITIIPETSRNVTRNDLCLSIGRTVIEDEYLANPNKSFKYDEYKAVYRDYHIKVMEKLASLLSGENIKMNSEYIREIDRIIDFETEFGKLTAQENAETTNETNETQRGPRPHLTLAEFASNFTSINWLSVFNRLSNISGVEINEICLEKEDYIMRLNEIIPKYPASTIDNYMCWSMFTQFLDYLGPQFRRLQVDFRRRVPEIRVSEQQRIFFSRWKECVFITTRILSVASSHLYLLHQSKHVSQARDKVSTMLAEIKEAMYVLLDRQDWLNDENVRTTLKKRIEESALLVGLPDNLLNQSYLDAQYRDLELNVGEVFINNWLNLAKHEKILELGKIGQSVDKNLFLNPPTEANAFYDWNIKTIILPLGILHEPIISEGRPKYLDYSTLGHILGHEIGHSLDKDPDNDNTSGIHWWPADLKAEYERRARCFAELYSTFKVDLISEYVNGNNTLTENICDFVGLQQAYLAWTRSSEDKHTQLPGLAHYSSDQLFFIQYGQVYCEVATADGYLKNLLTDPHSPGKFRANGVLVNTPQFADAFKCKPGSPMNPIDKCKLWSFD